MPAEWSTIPPTRQARRLPWWKKQINEACPHGRLIFMVNGTHVRNHYDSDFVQGGNGYAYTFIPKGELWIADETPTIEIPFVTFHECIEAELMKGGMDYDHAHVKAKKQEDAFRHELLL